jgi:hypothetical protein
LVPKNYFDWRYVLPTPDVRKPYLEKTLLLPSGRDAFWLEAASSPGRYRWETFQAGLESKVLVQTISCVPAASPENHFRQFTLVSYRLSILARTILLISGRLSCRQAHTSTLYNANPSPNRSHLSLSQPK